MQSSILKEKKKASKQARKSIQGSSIQVRDDGGTIISVRHYFPAPRRKEAGFTYMCLVLSRDYLGPPRTPVPPFFS